MWLPGVVLFFFYSSSFRLQPRGEEARSRGRVAGWFISAPGAGALAGPSYWHWHGAGEPPGRYSFPLGEIPVCFEEASCVVSSR